MAEEKKLDGEKKKSLLPHVKMPHMTLPHIHFPHPHVPHVPHVPHTHLRRGIPSWKGMFHSLLQILNPAPPVGGLDISSSRITFIRIEDNRIVQGSVPLMPGTLLDGKIKNKDAFLASLQKLHGEIAKKKEVVQTIVSIPSSNVYTEVFKLPYLSSEKLHEAARLNLQMISPLDVQTAYYDAEPISDVGEGGQIEFLGAFTKQDVIKDYSDALAAAQFSVVAVEFPGLALARLVRELGSRPNKDKFLIGLMVSDDGLQFFLSKDGALHFHYFVSLKIQEGDAARKMSITAVNDLLVAETQKVFNFASSHWSGETIEGFLVIAPSGFDELSATLTKSFSLGVESLSLSRFSDTPGTAFPALGAALRGAISRGLDASISLTAIGTEKRYEEHRLLYFANVWRNIIVAFVGFFAVVYLVAYGSITRYARSESSWLVVSDSSAIKREITPIQNDAKEFNRILGLYAKVKGVVRPVSPTVTTLVSLMASGGIVPQRFSLDASGAASVSGRAKDDASVTAFKQTLEKQSFIQGVTLPLSSIAHSETGVTFQVRFKILR